MVEVTDSSSVSTTEKSLAEMRGFFVIWPGQNDQGNTLLKIILSQTSNLHKKRTPPFLEGFYSAISLSGGRSPRHSF